MKNLLFIYVFMMMNNEIIIADFNKNTDTNSWYTTNDSVMGGISTSKLKLDEDGNGVFTGSVSTENNGGFAMVRLPIDIKITENIKHIVLKVKGDGKKYQLRLKSNRSQQHWFIHTFQTSTKMETFKIPLKDFFPSFRGYKLNMDNFSADEIKEIAILIGNKKDENFELTIDKISLN